MSWWTYRVHEQILPALRCAKVPMRWTDLTVRHTGYVDKELRARKLDRDSRILTRELEDRPGDPFVLFNLGAVAVERRDWHEALGFLNRSLAGSAPSDSIVRKLSWRPWPPSAAIMPRPSDCGRMCSLNARAIARRSRGGRGCARSQPAPVRRDAEHETPVVSRLCSFVRNTEPSTKNVDMRNIM